MASTDTSPEPRANLIAGVFGPAARGARFTERAGGTAETWPQSTAEDVAEAQRAAESALAAWRRTGAPARAAVLRELARRLERDVVLLARLGGRLGLEAGELEPHLAGLAGALDAQLARAPGAGDGVAWCAPDWRELVRAPLLDLARELQAGRTAVLISDARLPHLAERIAFAAQAAGVPAGVLGLLHGATRELVTLALSGAPPRAGRTLVASGLVERMVDLRRLCEGHGLADPRLRALRCGALEVDPARPLEDSAAEFVERAFGRGATLSGQLPGALGRVFCPARSFSRFTELFLAALEASSAARAPLELDEETGARARAACELGHDEGATCIAGGELDPARAGFQPTLFTNVEPYMASAKRQDPLPVLCFLRVS